MINKILTVLLISLLSVCFVVISIPSAKATTGASWLGWTYRKAITVGSATGAGTGYQINVTLNYGSGTDTLYNIYLNSHSKTDFSDVVFTASDGITPLQQWEQTKTLVTSTSVVFWVAVSDSLSSAGTTIYVYYGKADATLSSSGSGVFTFFDDFPGSSISTTNWQGDTASASVSGGIMTFSATNTEKIIYCKTTYQYYSLIGNLSYSPVDTSGHYFSQFLYKPTADWNNYIVQASCQYTYWCFQSCKATSLVTAYYGTPGTSYHIQQIEWTAAISAAVSDWTTSSSTTDTAKIPTVAMPPAFRLYVSGAGLTGYIYAEWVAVRKFVNPEPTITAIGGEESSVPYIAAAFNWSPNNPAINVVATFNGSFSHSSASITNYQWNFGDDNTTSGNYQTITHYYTANATYSVALTVTSIVGTASITISITIGYGANVLSYGEGYNAGYAVGWAAGNGTGYGTGWTAGNSTGWASGNATGYDTGWASGNQTGYVVGYDEGYSTGFSEGNASGYSLGWTIGNQSGYSDGYDSGYDIGWSEGNATGWAQGNETGWSQGNMTGYLEGYDDGHEAGYSLGYSDGYSVGHDAGYAEGYDVGLGVGYANGYGDGYFEGNASGWVSGNSTGYDSGWIDGNSTGFSDGYSSGYSTGYDYGWSVGNASGYTQGWDDGNLVGYSSGYSDGHAVGYIEGWTAGNETGWASGNLTGYLAGWDAGWSEGNSTGYAPGYSAGYSAGQASIIYVAACFELDNGNPDANTTLTADASKSMSSSEITNYAWDWGDTSSGSGVIATHEYTDNGTYQIKLTVTSAAGNAQLNEYAVVGGGGGVTTIISGGGGGGFLLFSLLGGIGGTIAVSGFLLIRRRSW